MEYGEAVTNDAFERAVAIGRTLVRDRPAARIEAVAAIAVGEAYCVCVTDGEDAAEHRLSDVHRTLIADVARQLSGAPPARKE
jgi:hypothetical protein